MKKNLIPIGSRVSYKSLCSEKMYYGTVRNINEQWAAVDDGKHLRTISTNRLKFIPNVFAGKLS